MKKFFLSLFLLIILIIPLVSQAKNPDKQNLYLGSDEVVDGNYYAFGNTVEILGTVNSDLIIFAGTAVIKGLVKGDVLAFGGSLKINGEVDGNVRVAGGEIEINGKIGKNVLGAGGYLITGPESEINGNLTFAFGSVKIDGLIQGKVDGAGGNLVFNNEVKGDVNLKTGEDGVIVLMPKANFAKDFYYRAPNKVIFKEGAKINGATHFQPLEVLPKKFIAKAYLFGKIIALFSLLIIGLVLISLGQKKVHETVEFMLQNPVKSLGWGIIYLIITPVLIFFLLITIIGLPLGLIALTLYLILLYLGQVLVSLIIGRTVLKYFKANLQPLLVLIIGLVIYEIIVSLPIFGWFLKLVGIIWALGAMIEVMKKGIKVEKTSEQQIG